MSNENILVARKSGQPDTIVRLGRFGIGGGKFAVIAGPCAVESENQLMQTAEAVKKSGACVLRGGAFKVRTSPYDFQGLGEKGIRLMEQAGLVFDLPTASEIVDSGQIDLFSHIDMIQIGARSMQNTTLLKRVGKTGKPVLLKRGLSAYIEELLDAAEYLMLAGCQEIVLCERGIRTFENATRNTLDLSAVPILKQRTHLPVIVDPSHGTGSAKLVESMSMAAIAAGADGLMIEVHPKPEKAKCDGRQAISTESFSELMKKVESLTEFMGKTLQRSEC